MTPRIALLDEGTCNRIAAGEVVERPSSAVKELVENAIDAGARSIVIRLEEGGKRLIEVADDGCGMGRDDAVLSLQRHATSKIRTAEDLAAVRTLGFRGEALPSIASVSRLTLTTRAAGEPTGWRLRVRGGEIVEVEETGGPEGTVVRVEELFHNTPARRAFLKSSSAELARALDAVGQLAVAYPEVAFRVLHHDQPLLTTPGGGDRRAALAAVWGRDHARRLLGVEGESAGVGVAGWICPPDVTRPGRSHELFFVNRRPVRHRLLSHALESAVRALTPEVRFPVAALLLEVPAALVDVNVHPAKLEVRFREDSAVHRAVSSAVRTALAQHGLVPSLDRSALGVLGGAAATAREEGSRLQGGGALTLPGLRESGLSGPLEGSGSSARPGGSLGEGLDGEGSWPSEDATATGATVAGSAGRGEALPGGAAVARDPRGALAYEAGGPGAAAAGSERKGAAALEGDASPDGTTSPEGAVGSASGGSPSVALPFAEQLRGFRVIGQLRRTYIVAQTSEGLALVDQHTAHERVLFERLLEARNAGGAPRQRLVVPFTVALGPAEAALAVARREDLEAAGWEIEPFGANEILVRGVPAIGPRRAPDALFRDVVDELAYLSLSRRLLVQRDHVTITNACKMAVKQGDPLEREEMEALLSQLADTRNPYLCPHGRPIVVTLSFAEIDRRFHRA